MFPFKISFTAATLRIDPVNHLQQRKLTPPHNESYLEQDIHRTPVIHIIHLSQTQLFFLLLVRGQSVLSEYILHFSLLVYSCINIHLLPPFLSFVFFSLSLRLHAPKAFVLIQQKLKNQAHAQLKLKLMLFVVVGDGTIIIIRNTKTTRHRRQYVIIMSQVKQQTHRTVRDIYGICTVGYNTHMHAHTQILQGSI